jgi:hypothetical protein
MRLSLEKVSAALLVAGLAGLAADNLRLGPAGLTWDPAIGGTPFFWEIAMALFVLVALVRTLRNGAVPLNQHTRVALAISGLLFLPVIFNILMFSTDINDLLIGNGQLRTILFQIILFFVFIFSPVQERTFRIGLYLIVFFAIINSLFSALGWWGIVEASHWAGYREATVRPAGLYQMPSRIGLLIVLGVGILLLLKMPLFLKIPLLSLLLYALVLSDSRTGHVGVLTLILVHGLVRFVSSPRLRIVALPFLGALVLAFLSIWWESLRELDQGRLLLMSQAVIVFSENPFGISLGEWDRYSVLSPPHNSFMFYSVYGGFISAIGVSLVFIWALWSMMNAKGSQVSGFPDGLLPVILAFLVASLFEQVTLAASSMIYFLFLLAFVLRAKHVVMVEPHYVSKPVIGNGYASNNERPDVARLRNKVVGQR